jgi:hypothetical protein
MAKFGIDSNMVFDADGKSVATRLSDHDTSLDSLTTDLADMSVLVSTYGAKGDGVTNDFTALQNAINSSNTTIELQQGKTYYFTTPLVFTGLTNKVIKGNGATLLYKGIESSNVPNGGVFQFTNCSNIYIENLKINGNTNWVQRPYNYDATYNSYNTARLNTRDAFYFDTCTNVVLSNLYSTKGRTGFFFVGSKNVKMINSTSYQTMADSIYICGTSNNIVVTNHYAELCNDDSFSVVGGNASADLCPSNITFTNCFAVNCFGAMAVQQSCSNVTHINCKSTNNRDIPFKLGWFNSTSAPATNCIIDNCYVSTTNQIQGNFEATASVHGTIFLGTTNSNNLIRNSTFIRNYPSQTMQIIVTSNGFSMSNCSINGYELTFAGGSNAIQLLNTVFNIHSGIAFNTCTNIKFNDNTVITDNTSTINGTYPIGANDSDGCYFRNNTIQTTNTNYISLYNDDGKGNHIVDSIYPVNINGSVNISSNRVLISTTLNAITNYKKGTLFFANDTGFLYANLTTQVKIG